MARSACERNTSPLSSKVSTSGHDGHAEERANFGFVDRGTPEPDVFLNNAAFCIQNERSGKGGNAAVLDADVVGGHGNGIVDTHLVGVLLDVGFFVVNIEADNLEAIFVAILEGDEVGEFRRGRDRTRRPRNCRKDHFAVKGRRG